MRIIAGQMRGHRLRVPEGPKVRPISARIKKSLFDILKELLPDANFLDLFAGSGTVGLEALSRGAKFAFFVEKDKTCCAAIEANLKKASLNTRAKVWKGDALEDLSWVWFRSGVGAFDVIFLGPPYKDEEKKPLAYSSSALARVAQSGLLAAGGVVICQHHVKEEVRAPQGLSLIRREKYGDTHLDFFRAAA